MQRRVPQVRRADPRGRPAGRVRGVAGRDGGGARRAVAGRDLRAARLGRRLDVRGRRRARPAGAPRWRVARRGRARGRPSTRTCPASTTTRTWSASSRSASRLGVELPAIARAVRALPGRAAAAGGARRRARRDRRRRLRAPPDRDPRDAAGAQGALRSRQADRGLRAALGHQPAQRLPGTTSPTRCRSPTRWCWRRSTRRRRSRRRSGWTSSGWRPTCGARTSRRA